MNRLTSVIATRTPLAEEVTRIVISGVDAICDPLGALFLPKSRTLIVSDLHLEKGAAFARLGMMLPPYDTLATLRLLEAVVERHDPATIISLGDSFHDRSGSALMPDAFRTTIEKLSRGRSIIWVNGNHDPDGAASLPGISADVVRHADLVFRHEPTRGPAIGEIAGHLHPAATVRRREKAIRRRCFASDGSRLVMPAFGVTTGSLDLNHAAMKGLFYRPELTAHMLGRDRVYSVRYDNLVS